MVSVRIVAADHYMAAPTPDLDVMYSDFRGSEVKQVPIIRVFGSTPTGKKVCLHVHGVFPYIYVPYDGLEAHEREAYKLSSGLDKALNVSLGKSNAATQHVYKISLVSGRPFYGYHEKEHQFFKIYLYNPMMVRRTADLLQSGAVLGKSFQPNEAHLSFILQFFIDFNLYGMNFINLSKVFYRRPQNIKGSRVSCLSGSTCRNVSLNSTGNRSFEDIPEEFYLPECISRMSSCEVEIDALATTILNRSTETGGITVIPGLAALWEEEKERRRMQGLSSQLSTAPSEARDDSFYTKSELFYLERLQSQLQGYQVGLSLSTENKNQTASALDTSGYPSETPENVSLQDATLVQVHLPTHAQKAVNQISRTLNMNDVYAGNDSEGNPSQNSILLDTQDEILMKDLGEMLEENFEDSILNSQPPGGNNVECNLLLEELAEEVEDNNLLEMSQVFHCDEKIGNENQVNMEEPHGGTTINTSESNMRQSISDMESVNQCVLDKNGFQSKDSNEGDNVSEQEVSFWDDESDISCEMEPIAQLDGADDIVHKDPLRIEGNSSTVHRRRLGVRGRTSAALQTLSSESRINLSSDDTIRRSVNNPVKTSENHRPQLTAESNKYNVSHLKSVCKINEDFRPLVSTVKHRRISELRRQSRVSLSVNKSKPVKSQLGNAGTNTKSHILRKDGFSGVGPDDNKKMQQLKDHNSPTNKRKLYKAFDSLSPSTTRIKSCTVRLEFLSEDLMDEICRKHSVVLSPFSADLFKGFCMRGEEPSCVSVQNKCAAEEQLCKQSRIQSRSHDVEWQKKRNLKRQSDFVIDEDFRGCSKSQDPVSNRNVVEHQPSSELGSARCFVSSSNYGEKSSTKSISSSPRKKNNKVSSGKVCYRPLNVKIQKSPPKKRNDKRGTLPSTSHMMLSKSMCESVGLQKEINVRKVDGLEPLKSYEQNIISSSGLNHNNMKNTFENANQIDETKGKTKPEKERSDTDEILVMEKKIEQTSLQNEHTSKCSEENEETGKRRVRKQLDFSYSSCTEHQDGVEDFSFVSDSSTRESDDDVKKILSDSSCDEGDLGIVSFCVEDIFENTFPSPSFDSKSCKESHRFIESKLSADRGETKAKDNEEVMVVPETHFLVPQDTVSFNDRLSLSSSESVADENPEEEIQPIQCIVDSDDNGIEYAPLLKAPPRNEVAEYKVGMEQKGLPFCSDPNDIPVKPMEVGELVLRLCSNRPSGLLPFENSLGCIGLEGHRKLILEKTFGGIDDFGIDNQLQKISKSALLPNGGSRVVIIKPCKSPPTYKDVFQWLNGKTCRIAQERTNEETSQNLPKKKKRLGIGCPLDLDDSDEDSDLISLSPCSSFGSQGISDQASKRITSYQSTPLPSFKTFNQCGQLASPAENCLMLSPINEHCEENDIIMCTPPPFSSDEQNDEKNKVVAKLKLCSPNRKKLINNNSSNEQKSLKDKESNSSLKAPKTKEKVGCFPKTSNFGGERTLNLQKVVLQRSSHLVGLGGSGHSSCQIDGMSPNNTFGFQHSPNNFQEAKAIQQMQFITVMTMEMQVKTRGDLRPDPEYDAIQAIFYSVVEDGTVQIERNENCETGILLVGSPSMKKSKLIGNCNVALEAVHVVGDETTLFKALGELIQKWNPDIFAGYEVEMQSWGYVIERGTHLGLDVKSLLSRIPIKNLSDFNFKGKKDEPPELDSRRIKDFEDYDPIQLPGRIVLNVWRLMRSEAPLMSYTFENVMYHLLHERIPLHSHKTLNDWWEHRTNLYRWITVEHWLARVKGVMRLLVQLDIVGRTSELARLFGIQFYEVFSRGSQFRVESMMLRLAKPLNYVCVSPNAKQRASMKAPEQLPLIMEPESRFFADPMIVLDFQSLYPSIIIAYNYCFSTCLGRVKHLGQPGPFEFGCTNLMVPPHLIAKLISKGTDNTQVESAQMRSLINFSPCGVAFVGKEVRRGVLPLMLSEILETRLMVKKALKENKGNKVVERVLNSRQLGLKLIANVTYGYTSANFSGRMPCIEVGDSVVSKGRETLERAIALVHEKWGSQGVRVVYGDTDSLFVLAKGFSKSEAFKLGSEIAELVTENNPKPVKLKLEKIFQPCLLQTKKRYVGYAYETPEQEKPIFDAKGIETVRRDSCPAVAKLLEKSLRLLFETRDVSLVKLHVQRQLGKLLSGRLSLQELTFAREYRGAAGYRPAACVPALQLARRWVSIDRRAEPRSGERVPYVIINGPPGLPLYHLVRSPNELLMLGNKTTSSSTSSHSQIHVNAHYYITKVLVPPLQRCFSLIGVDIESWCSDMPRKHRSLLQTLTSSSAALGNVNSNKPEGMRNFNQGSLGSKRSTIAEYFMTSDCLSCGEQLDVKNHLCHKCLSNPQSAALNIAGRCNSWERAYSYLSKLCQNCCHRMEPIDCISLDCPALYRRHQAFIEMEQATVLRNVLDTIT